MQLHDPKKIQQELKMYKVLVIGTKEGMVFRGECGYTALDMCQKQRSKTNLQLYFKPHRAAAGQWPTKRKWQEGSAN